ncbi:MAG: winged helix-turn-helix transcriptional regulator [Candidatus Micrarchaeota archaeon]|nr:winged helix-turn-helix transcriptional regulator [Candidatus Micrarchaeota archaeon]
MRIFRTKKAILEMISGSPKTMTDISKQLGLAPSTVSQHLTELKMLGAVMLVDASSRRKWKYYKKVDGFDFGVVERLKYVINVKAPFIKLRPFNYV